MSEMFDMKGPTEKFNCFRQTSFLERLGVSMLLSIHSMVCLGLYVTIHWRAKFQGELSPRLINSCTVFVADVDKNVHVLIINYPEL